jgi:dCMP deaminase
MEIHPHLARVYLKMAYAEATRSPDPSTQQGAVLVATDGAVLGRGHNRFPRGIASTPERLADRAQKYPRVTHAERAAIYDAVARGHTPAEIAAATLYCPWFACDRCAEVILEMGVRRVIGHADHVGFADPHSVWGKLVEVGLGMLDEAGVARGNYAGRLDAAPIRINYEPWTP